MSQPLLRLQLLHQLHQIIHVKGDVYLALRKPVDKVGISVSCVQMGLPKLPIKYQNLST